MINVPVRVKDALKSGDYKKNVKIKWQTTGTYTHVYDDTEITITKGLNPSEEWVWYLDDSYIDVPEECTKIVMSIEGTQVQSAGYDQTIYRPSTHPDVFEIKDGWTYVTIENPTTGHVWIDMESGTQYYSVTVSMEDVPIDYVLDNNNLVAESVKFDERMCSDTELKFGLCEGTSVEFQYFDLPNIRGEEISIEIDVEYKDENNDLAWYTIPMGWYEVKECSRQASTGIIKAIAYNKLHSEYLDQNVLPDILSYVGYGHSKSISDILNYLLNGYHIEKTDWEEIPCKLWREPDVEQVVFSGSWDQVYYLDGSGTWQEYKKTGFPPAYPYDYPTGQRFAIYSVSFYYVPVNDDPRTTSHHYRYEDIQIPAIWNIAQEALDWFYDWAGGFLPHVVELHTAEPMFMPWFGTKYYGVPQTFQQYASVLRTSSFESGPCGYIANLNTSVCGYTAPVNMGEFSGSYPYIQVPLAIVVQDDDYVGLYPPVPFNNAGIWAKIEEKCEELFQALSQIPAPKMYRKILSPMEEETLSYAQLESMNQITLRDLQSAVFEVDCQYGKLDRVTDLFAGIELNNGSLYPRDDLYPDDILFPNGQAEAGYPAMYSKLWADEGNVRTFRYLIITYKGTDNGQEVEKKIQRTVNANGTDDYNMSDNWLFKNIVWSDADVAAYADAMVAKMQNMSWFPFEMWCAGLPYLEAGDAIEIAMREGTYKSYVLRRNLNGIQNLQDEMIDGTLDIF